MKMKMLRIVQFNPRCTHLVNEDNIGRATVQLRHDQVYPVPQQDCPSVDFVDNLIVVTLDRHSLRIGDIIFAIWLINRKLNENYHFHLTPADIDELIVKFQGVING